MKKRIIAFTLTLALVLGALSAFVILSGAASPTPELDIAYCNLSFRDSVCIKYAVNANVSDVKILIWTSSESNYTVGTHDDEITEYYTEDIGGVSHMIFDYTELTAKQMTDVVYARAYSRVEGVDYYSDVNKYSILQYAYNKLGKTATASEDAELKEMLTHMLAYGAAAQKYLDDYKVDRLATADWYQVKLTAGVLDDGCTHGLYLPGDKVTMTAPTTDTNGATFAYWADSRNSKVATTATYELIVGSKNEVYTPVYVKYSSGLEFDSNGDGTCYVVGMGDCNDTELVIPPVSPDNDTVIGVEGFAGEAITSVSFPSTIEDIARRAFNNCTSLTDVYYDGTEEEWNTKVSIAANNDPILNATMHFNEPVVETFTVTFVDYDGTVLKAETVESGKSATAPTDPKRENYTFTGWDKSFDNVTSDLTVMAEYEVSVSDPTIVVSNATANAGATNVEITVALKNNPGVALIDLKISYDENALTLTNIVFNTEFGGAGTEPENLGSPASVLWYNGKDNSVGDMTFVTLVFSVSANAMPGDSAITVSYDAGGICDIYEDDVTFDIVNGKITVS